MMKDSDGGSVLKRRRRISPPKIHPNGTHSSASASGSPSPPSSSASGFNLELASLKSSTNASYTSLKDLLPSSPASSILSPTPATASAAVSSSSSASEMSIPIRNRLVKQAAWAYLQPAVPASPSSSSRRLCSSGEFLLPIVAGFLKCVAGAATRVYDWLVDALWLILCR